MTPGPVLVRRLGDAGRGLADVGGKGASLAAMTRTGLPVPDGFHVTTAAFAAWRAAGSAAVPDGVEQAVRAAYRALGMPVVVVRSSATAEDLPRLSFAGQQDTVLGVRGEDAVLAALVRCWRSLWTARAVAYRRRHGVEESAVAMAVVVQRQVAADAAGVAFSLDAVSGSRQAVVLNAVAGLGEALVGGEVAAEVVRVERSSGAVVPDRPVAIDAGQARRLAALVGRVEQLLGTDVDVEWCRQGDELWLVQARPVTAAGPPGAARRDPWNDSRSGDFLWTNTNVGEAVPDVMTPATWSMVQVFMSDAMATASIPPYVGYGRIGGRVYLNVSVMAALSRAVGVPERRYRLLTEEVFGRLPAHLEIPPVRASRLQILRGLVPMALHVLSEGRRDARHLAGYLAGHPELCERRRSELAVVDDGPTLARLWSRVLEPEFHRISWMLSAATRTSGASFVTIRRTLQRLVGQAAANALTAGLGGADGQLASLGLLEGLDQVERGEIDADTFARRHGHRGPHEFEISLPRPGEQPGWVQQQLTQRGSAAAGSSLRERLAAQRVLRQQAWEQLRREHPLRARLLGRQLAVWGRISRNREGARSEVIRYFWVLRAYALRAGELTGLGDDIFFLSAEEIVRVLRGERLPAATVPGRRSAYEAYRRLPPYPGLIRGPFDPFAWAADPARRSDLYLPEPSPPLPEPVEGPGNETAEPLGTLPEPVEGPLPVTVRGFPGSAGVVEGRVRVLTEADAGLLQPGEILVTTVTNVGWTPLFPRAGAVVTDVGAPLSHAAIVARELGVPAVVGCGHATSALHTGDRVRVDGAAGTVEVLEPADAS